MEIPNFTEKYHLLAPISEAHSLTVGCFGAQIARSSTPSELDTKKITKPLTTAVDRGGNAIFQACIMINLSRF